MLSKKEFDAKMAEMDDKILGYATNISRTHKPEEVRDSEKIAHYVSEIRNLLTHIENVQKEAAVLVADQFGLPKPKVEFEMAPLPELPFQEADFEKEELSKEEYETLRKTVLGEGKDKDPHPEGKSLITTLHEEPEPLPRGLQFMDDAWNLFKRGYRLFHSKR